MMRSDESLTSYGRMKGRGVLTEYQLVWISIGRAKHFVHIFFRIHLVPPENGAIKPNSTLKLIRRNILYQLMGWSTF